MQGSPKSRPKSQFSVRVCEQPLPLSHSIIEEKRLAQYLTPFLVISLFLMILGISYEERNSKQAGQIQILNDDEIAQLKVACKVSVYTYFDTIG